MQNGFKALVGFGVAALLTACGAVPKIDSDPRKLSAIKTVGVVRGPVPATYAVANFGHPGMAFGLVGGIVAAADMESKQKELAAAYAKVGPATVHNTLAAQVAQRLTAAGYDARVEDQPWKENKLEYADIKSDADAVLVLTPTMVGFVAPHMGSDYIPTLTIIAILLDKDRKTPLYRGYHASGWQPKNEGWRSSTPKATFGNFSDLMADPAKSREALDLAAQDIAATIAADLRRQ